MSSHREAEARLDRLLRWVDREVGEAMADSGFCRVCGTGVLEKRGRRYRCKSCGTPQDAPQTAPPPQQPSGGHNTRQSASTRDRHTKDHPSRTGQKKRLRFRRTDKKKKKQKESEAMALFEDFF